MYLEAGLIIAEDVQEWYGTEGSSLTYQLHFGY